MPSVTAARLGERRAQVGARVRLQSLRELTPWCIVGCVPCLRGEDRVLWLPSSQHDGCSGTSCDHGDYYADYRVEDYWFEAEDC